MSRVKVLSFTVHPDRPWSVVTPAGLFTAEPGQQVTIVCGESWEQAADAVRVLRESKPLDPSGADREPLSASDSDQKPLVEQIRNVNPAHEGQTK